MLPVRQRLHANQQINIGWRVLTPGVPEFVAEVYERGLGVAPNPKQSMHWLRTAAERGSATAQTELGLKYEKGEGAAADPAAAQHWYKMAAAQNYPLAQTRLSQMHDAQVASAGSDGSSCG